MNKIMESWMSLDDYEGSEKTFIDISGMKETKIFIHQHPFGLNFEYIYQVYGHNNPCTNLLRKEMGNQVVKNFKL